MIMQLIGSTCFEPINLVAGNPCSINDLLRTILDLDVYANAKITSNNLNQ